jgi:hypothetical protein
MHASKSDLNIQFNNVDYYANLKFLHKSFKKTKDQGIGEVNYKYNHPSNINFFYHMKKPAVCIKLDELKKQEKKEGAGPDSI